MEPVIERLTAYLSRYPLTGGTLDVDGLNEGDLHHAACDLLHWLRSRHDIGRDWQLRLDHRPETYAPLRQLIATDPDLARLFVIQDERLDFRPDIPPKHRSEIARSVAERLPYGDRE